MSDNDTRQNGNGAILTGMRETLDAYVAGRIDTDGFIQSWRAAAAPLALPAPYGAALDDMLRRLQMSAVFAQDSCSFSASAITDKLTVWLEKASQAK